MKKITAFGACFALLVVAMVTSMFSTPVYAAPQSGYETEIACEAIPGNVLATDALENDYLITVSPGHETNGFGSFYDFSKAPEVFSVPDVTASGNDPGNYSSNACSNETSYNQGWNDNHRSDANNDIQRLFVSQNLGNTDLNYNTRHTGQTNGFSATNKRPPVVRTVIVMADGTVVIKTE